MANLEKAIAIAVKAHAGQTRKNGTPYILHPLRVMFRTTSEDVMTAAVLHDVVEDTEVTLEDLKAEGFSEVVLEALALLTHDDRTPYPKYVKALSTNAIARKVKLSDLMDNMNLKELPAVREKDLERMKKYHEAYKTLQAIEQTKWKIQ